MNRWPNLRARNNNVESDLSGARQALRLDALEPFVPAFAVRLLAHRGAPGFASEAVEGAVLVADLAGFTALTENLSQLGQDGIERIQDVLNRCFTGLVATIASHGGEVVKFAGDATIAWWPVQGDGARAAVGRALAAARALHGVMPGLEREAGVSLRLRISLTAGPCWTALIGGERGRWEPVLGGDAVAALATLEPVGVGRIGMTPAVASLVDSGGAMAPAAALVDGERPSVEALCSCVPRHLVARLASGHARWMAELRSVSVLFATVPEARGAARDVRLAHAIARTMQRSVYEHGGSVVQLLIDDRGDLVLVASWGGPDTSYPDNGERAVRAAHALYQSLGADASVGVATGQVFSGLRGATSRCEYALIGRVVNLAARLMRRALGGVLCDAETRIAAAAIGFREAGDVTLKGIGTVAAFAPVARAPRARATGAMLIGRDRELAWLRRGVVQASERREPVVLLVEGEAGIGKSHLVGAFVEAEREAGRVVGVGSAEPLDASTPYGAVRPVFEELLGLAGLASGGAREQRVRALLARAPAEEKERLPLIAPLLGLDVPENDVTSAMRGRARAEAVADLIVRLLGASASGTVRVIVLDDAQWVDAASWALLEQVRRHASSLCAVFLARPHDAFPLPPEASVVLSGGAVETLHLAALGDDATGLVVSAALGVAGAGLPEPMIAFVRERTHGHPLLVRQLVAALREARVVDVQNGRIGWDAAALGRVRIPTTVQGIVASRVDSFEAEQQLALKVASVLGRTFPIAAVADLLPDKPGVAVVERRLAAVADAGLLRSDREGSLMFEHALVRDAVYEQIPPARRRAWHAGAGQWFEERSGGDPAYFVRIAAHWREARDRDRAPRAIERAGDYALRTGAYRDAVAAFSDLLTLARSGFDAGDTRPLDVTRSARAAWYWKLGLAQFDLGELGPARGSLEASASLYGEHAPASEAAARRRLALEAARYAAAGMLRRSVRPRADDAKARATARVLNVLGRIYHLSQEPAHTLYTIAARYNMLRHREPSAESMLALSGVFYLVTLLGWTARAEALVAEIKRIHASIGCPLEYADALYPVTVARLGQGAWAACAAESAEALAIFTRLGERGGRRAQLAVCANLHELLGEFTRSRELYGELLAEAREAQDALAQAWATGGLGMIALREGDLDRAVELAANAGAHAREVGEAVSELSALGTRCGARLRAGDVDVVATLLVEALPLLERSPRYATAHHNLNAYDMLAESSLALIEAGSRDYRVVRCRALACDRLRRFARTFRIGRPVASLWSAVEAAQTGRRIAARRSLANAVHEAERVGVPFDIGRVHYEAAKLSAGAERDRHLALADETFRRIGALREVGRVRSLRC